MDGILDRKYDVIRKIIDEVWGRGWGKTKYIEIGRHRGMIANAHFNMGSNSYDKVKTFKYLGS